MLLPFIELEKFGEEMGCWGEQESRFPFWGDFWSRWSIGRHASPINSLCLVEFFVCDHQEPGYLCPPVTLGLVRILQKEVKAPKRSLDLLKWCLQEYSLSLLVSMAA